MKLILLAATIAVASARPRYIALPSDQIAFVDLSSLHLRRAPRKTLEPPPPPQQQPVYQDYQEYQPQRTNEQYQPQQLNEQYQPIPVQQYVPQPIALAPQPAPARIVQNPDVSSAASQYESRPPDFGEYVDFGAHTGDNGAFGWYADYPINNHHDSYRRK